MHEFLFLSCLFCSTSHLATPEPTNTFNHSTFVIILDDFSFIRKSYFSFIYFFTLCLLSHIKAYHVPWKKPQSFLLACQSLNQFGEVTSLRYSVYLSLLHWVGLSDSSVGKESTCNAGDPGSIPGSGRSPGEGIGYALQYSWASLVV